MKTKNRIIVAILTAICMSMTMSFVMVSLNVGFGATFMKIWLREWAIGVVVTSPLSYWLPPLIARAVNHYIK